MRNWKSVYLKDIVISANTGLDAIKRAPIVEKETGVKCLRIQDISQKKPFGSWGNTLVTSENFEKFRLREDEIIMARTCSTGLNFFVKNNLDAVFNNGLVRIRSDKSKVASKYLYYLFMTRDFIGHIDSISGGTSVQLNMQIGDLLTYNTLLPTLPEQERIVDVLGSLDDKIDLLHRQNKTLEEMAETLFRQWFEKVEVHESTIVSTIEDIATVQNGYSFKSSEFIPEGPDTIEVLKMGHISADGGLRPSPKKDFVKRKDKYEKWILKKRDIILAMTDMKDNVVILGVPALIDHDNKYVLNQRVARIFLNDNSPFEDILILYMQMKEKNFISELQSKGNTGVQVNLGTDTIRQTKLVVPAKEFQKEIMPQLESIFNKLDHNSNHVQQLETLRDTLLPKLMSGTVSVNN
jgi:type I restriction enzyme S subunit